MSETGPGTMELPKKYYQHDGGGGTVLTNPENERSVDVFSKAMSLLERAELYSERNQKRYDESIGDRNPWNDLNNYLEELPDGCGDKLSSFHDDKSNKAEQILRLFDDVGYKELGLKERLTIYVEARKSLMNRFVEVEKAMGSLVAMGYKPQDIPFEGMIFKIQNIRPQDWWVVIHGDEIFPEFKTMPEAKEWCADVDEALCVWWDVGHSFSELPEYLKKEGDSIPGYKDTLDNQFNTQKLRGRIREYLGNNSGEKLANRIFTVSLTYSMFDKNRDGHQGAGEDRDLMYFDFARVKNLLVNERNPQIEYTTGRYFARDNQAELEEDKIKSLTPKMRKRYGMVLYNENNPVFQELESMPEGEFVSDFFNTVGVNVEDYFNKDKKYIQKKLSHYAINADGTPRKGGWKDIPFYNLGKNAYNSSYFGYPISIAIKIQEELEGITWDKNEELLKEDYWSSKRALINRVDAVSPRLNTIISDFRGIMIRDMLKEFEGDFNKPDEIKKLSVFNGPEDLSVFSDDEDKRRALSIIENKKKGDIYKEIDEFQLNYKKEILEKIRMVHALGVIWSGSLEPLEGGGFFQTESPLSERDVAVIISLLKKTDYVTGEFLIQLRKEVNNMRFGKFTRSFFRRKRKK